MSKLQANNAKVHGEITGLEKKFAITNDPKDLQKLTKARQKLTKGESDLAKAMKSESKAQDSVGQTPRQCPGPCSGTGGARAQQGRGRNRSSTT